MSKGNKESGVDSKSKSTSASAFPKKTDPKSYVQLNHKSNSNSDNHFRNNRDDSNNKQINNHISQNPSQKFDDKYNEISNEGRNVKKREADRKDIKDIGDFLRNKKNDMK